jgi:hypothetical protein
VLISLEEEIVRGIFASAHNYCIYHGQPPFSRDINMMHSNYILTAIHILFKILDLHTSVISMVVLYRFVLSTASMIVS